MRSRQKRSRPSSTSTGRHTAARAEAIPPVLPLIVAEAHEDTLVVTTNGDKATATTIARADFWTHIAEQVSALGVATRVEMHEPGGRVLADILDPPPPEPDTPGDDDTDGTDDGAEESGLVELTGEDFTPGEEILVALVIRHASADAGGRTRVLIDRGELDIDELPEPVEVVLAGRLSRTVTIRPLT
ncbi:hypothetical protein [Brevibacterium linens]|uniref:hypothetical protein n=1 Tax=Brevibacterium linens TaxID=1703 RepID=UPI000FCA5458|nr:hypothetical protein [Brevibacterium linens]